jgi:hypothetical protein
LEDENFGNADEGHWHIHRGRYGYYFHRHPRVPKPQRPWGPVTPSSIKFETQTQSPVCRCGVSQTMREGSLHITMQLNFLVRRKGIVSGDE